MTGSWQRPSQLMDILMQSYLSVGYWDYDAMDGTVKSGAVVAAEAAIAEVTTATRTTSQQAP